MTDGSRSRHGMPGPRRPRQVIAAGVLVVGSAGIVVGLIGTIVAYLVFFPTQLVFDVPLVLLVPVLAWLGYLAYGLFLVLLAPVTLSVFDVPGSLSSFFRLNPLYLVRLSGFILLTAGFLLSVVTPLLLLGGGVTTYLRRPRTG